MDLIRIKKRQDFGTDYNLQFLNHGGWSLVQASVSWNDYPSWPYLQIKSGTGSVLSILFWAYKFGFDIGIIERTWDWDRFIEEDMDIISDDAWEITDPLGTVVTNADTSNHPSWEERYWSLYRRFQKFAKYTDDQLEEMVDMYDQSKLDGVA